MARACAVSIATCPLKHGISRLGGMSERSSMRQPMAENHAIWMWPQLCRSRLKLEGARIPDRSEAAMSRQPSVRCCRRSPTSGRWGAPRLEGVPYAIQSQKYCRASTGAW